MNTERLPPWLQSGDIIRIVSPCGTFDRGALERGVALIREAGFEPRYDERLFARHRYLAGTDEERLAELHDAIDDREARAIWVARGGYGATRLLPHIDTVAIAEHPKWLVGFSDVTALHATWHMAKVPSFHGPNVTTLPTWGDDARASLWGFLREGTPITLSGETVRGGEARGVLVGGNLTVLAAMAGTPYLPPFDDKIVLLEDVGERPYQLDRALTGLCQAGVFDDVAGVVVGQLTHCVDPPERHSGVDARCVVTEILAELEVPVIAGLPIGHEPSSFGVPLGVEAVVRDDALIVGVR